MSERRSSSEESASGSAATQGRDAHRRSNDQIAETVIEATAEATGTDPLELEPLYTTVDPDALQSLVGGPPDGANAMVTFDYEGCRVTVHRGGRVEVEGA